MILILLVGASLVRSEIPLVKDTFVSTIGSLAERRDTP